MIQTIPATAAAVVTLTVTRTATPVLLTQQLMQLQEPGQVPVPELQPHRHQRVPAVAAVAAAAGMVYKTVVEMGLAAAGQVSA